MDALLQQELPLHPDLVTGELENGMKYVILPNAVPPERFEAHLQVHVGSVDEKEDEQGIAHIVEHVTFLGSKKRDGLLGTGARSNAYTDFHHTVFHVHSPVTNITTGERMLPQVCMSAPFDATSPPLALPARARPTGMKPLLTNLTTMFFSSFESWNRPCGTGFSFVPYLMLICRLLPPTAASFQQSQQPALSCPCWLTFLQVLDVLQEIAFEPQFLASRIEKERRAVLAEAQMMNTIEYRVDCQLLKVGPPCYSFTLLRKRRLLGPEAVFMELGHPE